MWINAKNVNNAYSDGVWWLRTSGKVEESRNGPVLVSPAPVLTCYHNPCERVLFDPVRNVNPFFHLFECIWMLAGSRDVAYVAQFNKRMLEYSDDGTIFHGAYGHRWREAFGFDQLDSIIGMLRHDKTTRRAVLTMWNPEEDLESTSKDIPCNTHIYFRVDQKTEQLDLTVCCRSNDVLWGAYGTNAVHFSFLQEFIAGATGLRVGKMFQLSNNFHIYKELPQAVEILKTPPTLDIDPYAHLIWIPLGVTMENWPSILAEYELIVGGEFPKWSTNEFISQVLAPMNSLWSQHRAGTLTLAQVQKETRDDIDWHVAARRWFRRLERYSGSDASGGQALQGSRP